MLTQQVEEHCAAVLSVGVRGKVNLLVPELVEQLRTGAGQLHAHTLHAVAQLRADCLHDRNRAILVQVHLLPIESTCISALISRQQSSHSCAALECTLESTLIVSIIQFIQRDRNHHNHTTDTPSSRGPCQGTPGSESTTCARTRRPAGHQPELGGPSPAVGRLSRLLRVPCVCMRGYITGCISSFEAVIYRVNASLTWQRARIAHLQRNTAIDASAGAMARSPLEQIALALVLRAIAPLAG
jgi:hypothetical protein